jgi:hypothetical protein
MDRETHRETVIDTGIFKVTECTPGEDMEAFAQWLADDLHRQPTFWDDLEQARLEAREILVRHGLPPDGRVSRPDEDPPVCDDAAYVSSGVDELRARWSWMEKEEVANRVFYITTAMARMRTRPFEPAAERGLKQIEGAAKGGRARADSEKPGQVLARFQELQRADPSVKVGSICAQVADEFDITERTVYRYRKAAKSADGASHCQ